MSSHLVLSLWFKYKGKLMSNLPSFFFLWLLFLHTYIKFYSKIICFLPEYSTCWCFQIISTEIWWGKRLLAEGNSAQIKHKPWRCHNHELQEQGFCILLLVHENLFITYAYVFFLSILCFLLAKPTTLQESSFDIPAGGSLLLSLSGSLKQSMVFFPEDAGIK